MFADDRPPDGIAGQHPENVRVGLGAVSAILNVRMVDSVLIVARSPSPDGHPRFADDDGAFQVDG
jgi:hypothetical protein